MEYLYMLEFDNSRSAFDYHPNEIEKNYRSVFFSENGKSYLAFFKRS